MKGASGGGKNRLRKRRCPLATRPLLPLQTPSLCIPKPHPSLAKPRCMHFGELWGCPQLILPGMLARRSSSPPRLLQNLQGSWEQLGQLGQLRAAQGSRAPGSAGCSDLRLSFPAISTSL